MAKLEVNVTRVESPDDDATFQVDGVVDRGTVSRVRKTLLPALKRARGGRCTLDMAGVTRMDSAGAALCHLLYEEGKRVEVDVGIARSSAASTAALKLFNLPETATQSPRKGSLLERIGEQTWWTWQGFVDLLVLTADTVLLSLGGARRTRRVRRGALVVEANRVGVQALPIVVLICFLVGVVVALQSAAQLRQFGASIYVVDLIAVGMTREMGPLMTAIMIAGRSGAAIAAEIATMKVSEEIDALEAMGLNPTRYIVVPKFQAMTLTMPGLVVFANLFGILGGFLVALIYLNIGFGAFWGQLTDALVLKDIVTGLVKSVAFAWIICLVAAHKGFQARGGAESVGLVTTASVVSAIFWVIVADACFSMLFYFGG